MSFGEESAKIRQQIFRTGESGFTSLALEVFSFQYQYNQVYRTYCELLKKSPFNVKTITDIPFLPISQFKRAGIRTGNFSPDVIFESSGTTGSVNSRHELKDISIYEESFLKCFHSFYGDPSGYCIIGLLPSYLERQQSSLVHMVDKLIRESRHPQSGFYLYDHSKLYNTICENEKRGVHTLLIGVTYALLDFAEKYPMKLTSTTVMETGGMKGRRKEITREEVHALLCEKLGLSAIHSEYGMTELLSQAYSNGHGIFRCPDWMKVLLRKEDDPFEIMTPDSISSTAPGVINVIDLANLYSCSFIATDDLGTLNNDGSFSVLGRLDNSDIRGCSLMVS